MLRTMDKLWQSCTCCGGIMCLYCVQLTLAALVIISGAIIAWKPKDVIHAQTALYRIFNWRLEPIDMEKEVRDLRRIGFLMLAAGVIATICIF